MNLSKIVIFAGQHLKQEEFITPISLQRFIADEIEQGGIWLPLNEVSTCLMILKIAGFLDETLGVYTFAHKNIVREEKIVNVCEFAKSLPPYIDGIDFEEDKPKKKGKKNG